MRGRSGEVTHDEHQAAHVNQHPDPLESDRAGQRHIDPLARRKLRSCCEEHRQKPEPCASDPAKMTVDVPAMKHNPESASSFPIPILSTSGLPIAIVNANPRNATPRTAPIISAE